MRAAIYARVSSKPQLKTWSLAMQEELCRKYADAKQIEITAVISGQESAYTDSWLKRPLLRRVLLGAARGEFEIILVAYSDRWMRSVGLNQKCVAFLGRYGVRLVFTEYEADPVEIGEIERIFARRFIQAGWTPPPWYPVVAEFEGARS